MSKTFAELGLHEHLLQGVKKLNYENPTPVQEEAIPQVLNKRDVVAIAQTGTGKTAAFSLPALQLTADKRINKKNRGPYVLVISPTRELAQQASRMVDSLREVTGQRSICVTGGVRFGPQINACQRGSHVLIATPGRLQDLINRNVVHLNQVEIVVLDEADRMLDMGFWKDVKEILTYLPQEHQTLLFSATMPDSIKQTVDTMLKDPAYVTISQSGDTSDNVEQVLCPVSFHQKDALLLSLLKKEKPRRAIVFCRTKHRVDMVNDLLRKNRFRSAPMHSDCSQIKREKALAKFRKAHLEVLVATDVLARGIDVANVDLVVNFDIPLDPEDYVHRIGRTGRAGAEGKAFSFMAPDEMDQLRAIEFFTKHVIEISDLEGFDYDEKRLVPDADRSVTKTKKQTHHRGSSHSRNNNHSKKKFTPRHKARKSLVGRGQRISGSKESKGPKKQSQTRSSGKKKVQKQA